MLMLWLLLLFGIGYTHRLVPIAILNGSPIIASVGLLLIAERLSSSEDTDQAGFVALAVAGAGMFIVIGNFVVTSAGWLAKVVVEVIQRRQRLGQEN